MFRHTIPIGRIFGISVDLDYSWFLVLGLLTWMLAVSYYPAEFAGWSAAQYWFVGLATALMLFVSVLIHELGHAVVAKKYGMPVPRIVLFIFGGVSEIGGEPPNASAEFWIAVVGPIVSFVLAAFFWEIEPLLYSWPQLYALAKYLSLLNLILGVFNLIPGFPLDGGRVMRAVLWFFTGKYRRATAIAATTGRFIGFLLIFLGVWQALRGNFIGGLWTAFIGWFLESAAASQLQQEVLKSHARRPQGPRCDAARLSANLWRHHAANTGGQLHPAGRRALFRGEWRGGRGRTCHLGLCTEGAAFRMVHNKRLAGDGAIAKTGIHEPGRGSVVRA